MTEVAHFHSKNVLLLYNNVQIGPNPTKVVSRKWPKHFINPKILRPKKFKKSEMTDEVPFAFGLGAESGGRTCRNLQLRRSTPPMGFYLSLLTELN